MLLTEIPKAALFCDQKQNIKHIRPVRQGGYFYNIPLRKAKHMGNFRFCRSEYIEIITIKDTILKFQEHSHSEDFVITMITDGCAEFVINTKQMHISKGDIFTAPPYEPHSLFSDIPVNLISVCIKKQAVYEFDKIIFSECVEKAFSERKLGNGISNSFIKAALCIYDKHHTDKRNNSNECEQCRTDMEQFPEAEKHLSQLADEAHFSKYHFIRQFKKISGLTPRKFQIQSRIRKAQQFLREGKSAAETAAELGFYDQSHFDKYFKSIVGITPSEYICSVSNILQDKS